MKKILWLDDHISGFRPFPKYFKKFDLELTLTESVDKALELTRGVKYDPYLVDLKLPGRDGTFFIDHLLKEYGNNAKICVISSFLYTKRYRNFLETRGDTVSTLEKDIPLVDTNEFKEEFVDVLKLIMSSEVPENDSLRYSASYEAERIPTNISPFRIRFSAYLEMNELAQSDVTRRARRIGGDTAAKEFKKGAKWVILCGESGEVFHSSDTLSNLPSHDDLLEIGKSEDRVPFLMQPEPSDVETEDDSFLVCDGDPWLQSYPTIRVAVDGPSDSIVRKVHFDTGSRRTYFSYEELKEIGRHKTLRVFSPDHRLGREYVYYDDVIAFRIINPDGSGEKIVSVGVRVVLDWLGAPFVAPCTSSCESPDRNTCVDGRYNCLSRSGLIGRDLLARGDVEVLIRSNNMDCVVNDTGDGG